MTTTTLRSRVANGIAFQAGWFACVLSAARDAAWSGIAAALGILAWHLWRSSDRPRAAAVVLATTIAGVAWDSVLVTSGWITYRGTIIVPGLPPLWIAILWMLFATTLDSSLAWLQGRPVAGMLLGMLAGPAAYLAGESLGALALADRSAALVALAIGWGVLVPLLVACAAPGAPDRSASRTDMEGRPSRA